MLYNALARHMRKEILLAIVVGVVFGLGVTFAVYTLRQKLFRNTTPDTIEQSKQQTAGTGATPTPQTSLVIKKPVQDLATDQETQQIVGRAQPNSIVVALAADDEFITTADQDGDFALEVALVLGGNKITVVATTPEGSQESTILNVVYAPDLSAPTATAGGQP